MKLSVYGGPLDGGEMEVADLEGEVLVKVTGKGKGKRKLHEVYQAHMTPAGPQMHYQGQREE